MLTDLRSAIRPALVLTLLFALLTGIAYPLALTAFGQALFPAQANGSLVRDKAGQVIGSELIGQGFASDRYFHGRPSAAGKGYDAAASSGSNLGPTSQALVDRIKADIATNSASAPGRPIPPDLVTASASGLDPHISPEAAFYQVDRIAAARRLDPAAVRQLVEGEVRHPLLGEPQVNVFALNRALDERAARP